MNYIYGVIAYLLAGSLIVSIDAYLEYLERYPANHPLAGQRLINKFRDYNRPLAIQILLFWPLVVAWVVITGFPAVLFWVFKHIGGSPLTNIKESVGSRRRLRASANPEVEYDDSHQVYSD